MHINPPHEALDKEKLNGMIKALKSGSDLHPVLVNQNQAYSGSHRLEAWNIMDIEPNYVEITDDEYKKIMKRLNLDPVYDQITDFEPFLEEAKLAGIAQNAM